MSYTDESTWRALFDKKVQQHVETQQKYIEKGSEEFKRRVEARTPIGNPSLWKYPAPSSYTPGTLRASWDRQYTGFTAKVFNPQPYAQRVEEGWSTQAPYGMMRVTILEWPEIVKQLEQELNGKLQ